MSQELKKPWLWQMLEAGHIGPSQVGKTRDAVAPRRTGNTSWRARKNPTV